MTNQSIIEKYLANRTKKELENIKLPNFVKKDGSLCKMYKDVEILDACDENYKCDGSNCLMNLNSKKILIDYEIISFYKTEDKKIYEKLNELDKIIFVLINDYNKEELKQKKFLEKNKVIGNKLSNDLKEKNQEFESKNNNYNIEYYKIEELNERIEKHKKTTKLYLEMLKYLIPILILSIIFFVILENSNLF